MVNVVGMGIVLPRVGDVGEFTDFLKKGETAIRRVDVPDCDDALPFFGAFVENTQIRDIDIGRHGFSAAIEDKAQQLTRRASPTLVSAVDSVMQAWQDAGLADEVVSPERIGLYAAAQNTTNVYQYQAYEKFRNNPEYLTPRFALENLDTYIVGCISEIFNIRGEGCLLGGASASSNVAIVKAIQALNAGIVDVCIVQGCLSELSPLDLQAFRNVGALAPKEIIDNANEVCRPFDARHEGFVPGQASACIILESEQSTARRNAAAKAKILAGKTCLSATSSSSPCLETEVNLIESLLMQAQLKASDIDYINAHATSSPIGDITEAKAIKQVFAGVSSQPFVNATKGLTGHCLNAAGTVEIIACVKQMQNAFLHANKNLKDPIESEINFCSDKTISFQADTIISTAFGFGGFNSALLLNRV